MIALDTIRRWVLSWVAGAYGDRWRCRPIAAKAVRAPVLSPGSMSVTKVVPGTAASTVQLDSFPTTITASLPGLGLV